MSITSILALGSRVAVAAIPLAVRLRGPREEPNVLESPLRQQIVRIVHEQPGIPLGVLLQRVPVGWGTLYHHIHKLSSAGLIQARTAGRRRLLYPPGEDPLAAAGDSIIRGATARRIAKAILDAPDSSIPQLAERLGESHRVVYYHVKRLLEAGLVTSTSRTRHKDLVASPRLAKLLSAPWNADDAAPEPVLDDALPMDAPDDLQL